MSVTNPPGWLQNAGSTHTAAQLRQYLAGTIAGRLTTSSLRARSGIHPSIGNQLVVTQTGSPSMAVIVDTGVACVAGSEAGTQGNYWVSNDAQVTLSVTAAHATLPRIDIVVFNVRDSFYSGANNDSQLQVIAGTPASSPVAPAAPNNSITIAQIAVGAAVTQIVNANITDLRFYLAALGGFIPARSLAAAPASTEIIAGQHVWANDVAKEYLWDGSAYNQIYPGYNKIAETILGVAAATVTFSSIPSIFRHLRIVTMARGDTAATSIIMNVRMNNDTGANYDSQRVFGQAASPGANEYLAETSIRGAELSAASAAANHAGIIITDIPWYALTSYIKLIRSDAALSFGTASGNLTITEYAGRWRNTAAINRIDLIASAGNFAANSSFALYGIV